MSLHNRTCFENHMGVWGIEQKWLREALSQIRAGHWNYQAMHDDGESLESYQKRIAQERMAAGASKVVFDGYRISYEVFDGVAVIAARGPMMKFDSKFGGVNTVRLRGSLRLANRDADVSSILMQIDSPGGSVAGNQELADEVSASGKLLNVYIEDLGASCAYWIASQANRIFANTGSALVGSIGVYSVLYDDSKAFDAAGVKAIPITSGPLKAQGEPGVPVTQDLVDEMQGIVDAMAANFIDAVAAGRDMTKADVKKLATGGVYLADHAKKLGLVDEIASFDSVLAHMQGGKKGARLARAEAAIKVSDLG